MRIGIPPLAAFTPTDDAASKVCRANAARNDTEVEAARPKYPVVIETHRILSVKFKRHFQKRPER